MGLRIGLPVFCAAFAADLATKVAVVAAHVHPLYFNTPRHGLPLRLLMCAVAIGMAVLMTRAAAWRGLGRPWAAWVGGGLLVAGVLANGVSPLLWHDGVPDWIVNGDWIGNIADFEIFFGLVGGFFGTALGVVLVYARQSRRS